jgi:phosphoribosylanthranilate isomerase
MVKVKICGITNLDDALMALEAGADALGFVFCSASPRHIFPEQAALIVSQLPPFIQTVGLFVNESPATVNATTNHCGIDIVQLHGEESPDCCAAIHRRIIKAVRVKDITSLETMQEYPVSTFLLDAWSPAAYGGTGQTFNWDIAAMAAKQNRIILAGGLTPENVAEAILQVRPYGVDVSSGVESSPGKKDAAKVLEFISKAKEIQF